MASKPSRGDEMGSTSTLFTPSPDPALDPPQGTTPGSSPPPPAPPPPPPPPPVTTPGLGEAVFTFPRSGAAEVDLPRLVLSPDLTAPRVAQAAAKGEAVKAGMVKTLLALPEADAVRTHWQALAADLKAAEECRASLC